MKRVAPWRRRRATMPRRAGATVAERVAGCRNHARHWFAYYGWVRSSAPTCRHCGAPNPKYDPERDPYAGTERSR